MKRIFFVLILIFVSTSISAQSNNLFYIGSVSSGFGSETSPYTGNEMRSYNFAFDVDKMITLDYSIGLRLQFKQTNSETINFDTGQYTFSTSDWGVYLSYKVHPFRTRSRWDFILGAMFGVNSARKYNALSGTLPKEEEKQYFYGEESRAAFSVIVPITIGYYVGDNVNLNLSAFGHYVERSYLHDKFTWNLNLGVSLQIK